MVSLIFLTMQLLDLSWWCCSQSRVSYNVSEVSELVSVDLVQYRPIRTFAEHGPHFLVGLLARPLNPPPWRHWKLDHQYSAVSCKWRKTSYYSSLIESRTELSIGTKSVTFFDLQRRNGRHFALFSELGSFAANTTSNSLKLDPCLWLQCSPKNLVFDNIWFILRYLRDIMRKIK